MNTISMFNGRQVASSNISKYIIKIWGQFKILICLVIANHLFINELRKLPTHADPLLHDFLLYIYRTLQPYFCHFDIDRNDIYNCLNIINN